jgi:hypothetical protein
VSAPGSIARLPPPFKKPGKLALATRLLTLGPMAAATIAAEDRLQSWWPLRFPRAINDLQRDPDALARLLKTPSTGLIASPVPAGATLVSQRRLGSLANEPDKDRTTASWELTFRDGGRDVVLRVITKFQSGRGMPLYMQAMRAVVERRFHREVAFYRALAADVPVRVARPWFADAETAVNRVCLVLEYVDGFNPADWRGCPLPGMRALLREVARLNARYVDRASSPQLAWIPARRGLDYADFVELFIGQASPLSKQMWRALRAYFDARPVTLVHGDCRPGNMLFLGGSLESIVPPAAGMPSPWPDDDVGTTVVMSDWEAVNVAPLLWDFTYCTVIGLRAIDRQAWGTRLLDEFLAALAAEGVAAAAIDPATASLEVDLLVMVLAYVSLTVYENGLWNAQGNSAADLREWTNRVHGAVLACDADRAAAACGVDPSIVAAWQADTAARLVPPA